MTDHQTIQTKIYKQLLKFEAAKPIPYRLLKGFGAESSTQRALHQLCEDGYLARVMTGFYVRPKQLQAIPGVTITCSPEDLAKAWANERGYVLTTTGFEEAYHLKFQTQMPMQKQFWTNGPTKAFTIGNATVTTKHVPNSFLLWHDRPEGRLYRALHSLSCEHTKADELRRALTILYPDPCSLRAAKKSLLKTTLIREWHPTLKNI